MTAKIENAFSMGKQNGINWATVCGNAAEVDCEHGEMRYRGEFVRQCSMMRMAVMCSIWTDGP